MASGLQDIPLRRIPEKWDRQWFIEFVRDVLRLADARNIRVGPEFSLTGQSNEVANLSMTLGGINLDRLADQPALTLIGNPAAVSGVLQALVVTDSGRIDFTLSDPANTITADIVAASVANSFLAIMAEATVKGRQVGSGTGSPVDLTAAELNSIVGTASIPFLGGAVAATPAVGYVTLYPLTNQGHTGLNLIDEDGTTLRICRDNVFIVRNTSGAPMTKGTVVSITGSTGATPTVGLADADTFALHAEALLTEDIADNGYGLAMCTGLLNDLDTSALIEGGKIYLSQTAGAYTQTAPTTGQIYQELGTVIRSHVTQGVIEITVNTALGNISNNLLADMAQATIKGRASGAGTGKPTDLTGAQVATIISYTAADVLNKLLTVDGSGSGLDADLLDGIDSLSFAQRTIAQTISGAWTITGAFNFTTRQQVFGTTTANIALVSGLADTGVSIQAVEHIRTHRVAAEPFIGLTRVNTSYAAPSALVSGNSAGSIAWGGYDGTTIQALSALMFLDITETWSSTARGGNLRFQTTTTGTTTRADRLQLGANSTGGFALVPDGAVTQCGFGFITDPDTGAHRIAANNWALDAGGSKIVDIATTGITITGNVSLGAAGNKLLIKEGSNASMGSATLVAGTATVNTTLVTASSRIFLTIQSLGTVAAPKAIAVTARTAGTSFTITSADATDTSVVAWHIVEPA